MSTPVHHLRAKLAAQSRHNPTGDHDQLRRDLAAAKLEEHVSRVVADAPPLTAEQRDRIAALLRGANR